MAFFIPSYIQKRLLHYALSRLEVLDTDALDLERLDVGWGKRSTIELRDVGLRRPKLAALLHLPACFDLTTARVGLVRVTVPADIHVSPISIELNGIEAFVRQSDKSQEKAQHDSHRPYPRRRQRTPAGRRSSSRSAFDDNDDDDDADALPSTQDLAKSFLAEEPQSERAQLQAALNSQTARLDQSVASTTTSEEDPSAGYGVGLNLPSFLAGFLKDIANRVELRIKDVTLNVDSEVELGGLERRSLIDGPTLQLASIRIRIDEVDVKGVTSSVDAATDDAAGTAGIPHSDQAKGKQTLRLGKRLVTLKGIRGSLFCEESLFNQLFRASASPADQPSHDSPVNSWSKKPSESVLSTFPEGFNENSSQLDEPSLEASEIESDHDKFADADEDEVVARSATTHYAPTSYAESSQQEERDGQYSKASVFEDAEDSPPASLADSGLAYGDRSFLNPYDSSFGNLQDALRSFRAERKETVSGVSRISSPATPLSQQDPLLAVQQTTASERSATPDLNESLHQQGSLSGEEGLAQSMVFSNEQAQSMYMSIHETNDSDGSMQQIPGAWQDYSESSLGHQAGSQPDMEGSDTTDTGFKGFHNAPLAASTENDQPSTPVAQERSESQDQSCRNSGVKHVPPTPKKATHGIDLMFVEQINLYIPGLDSPTQRQEPEIEYDGTSGANSTASLTASELRAVPGVFSVYAESRKKRSDSATSKASVEAAPTVLHTTPGGNDGDNHDQVEIDLASVHLRTDVITLSILVQCLRKLSGAFAESSQTESKQSRSGVEESSEPLDLSIKLTKLELILLESFNGEFSYDLKQIGTAMFKAEAKCVVVHHVAQKAISKTVASVDSVSLGFEDEDIFKFDKAARMRTSVRDANELNTKAISISLKTSSSLSELNVSTLPFKVNIDLDRLDESMGSLGGLSGLVELGSSIFSDSSAHQSPKIPAPTTKARSVRFETPESPTSRGSKPPGVKSNVRIGGAYIYLRGKKCGILYESTAVKLVARDSVLGIQIDESRLSGPHFQHVNPGSAPFTIKLRNNAFKYLFTPEEGDLTRLISLLTPSKDKFEAEDDFLVDTLISQRRKGAVLRANLDTVEFTISDYTKASALQDFVNDLSRLSSLTKYLPQDSRPGLLTLAIVKHLSILVDTHKSLGTFALSLTGAEAAHIGAPLLVAVGVEKFGCKYGKSIDLIKEVVPYKGPDNPLMLMARMIGDELEPTIKLKFWNTCLEYNVPLMIALKELVEEPDTDKALVDVGLSVAALADHSNPTKYQSQETRPGASTSTEPKPLKFDLALRDCAVGLKPNELPSKALLILTDTSLRGSVPDERGLKATLDFRRAAFLLIDDEERLVNSVGAAPDKATTNDTGARHIAALCRLGFVSMLSVSAAHAVLEMQKSADPSTADILDLEFRNDLFVLETCADSTNTLGELFGALSPPSAPEPGQRYRTEIAPVMDMMASFTGEEFPIIPTEREKLFDNDDIDEGDEFADEELEADLEAFGDLGDIEHSLMSDVEKESLDKVRRTILLEDPQSQIIDPVHGLDDARSEILGGFVVPMAMPPRVEGTAHKWDSTRNKYVSVNHKELAQSPIRIRIRDMHIIWNLYDGYDWEHTREAITQAVMEVESRVEERRSKRRSHGGEDEGKEPVIEDFLFNSIYIGIPANEDPRDLSRKINKDLDDMVSETGTQLSTTPSRPSTLSRAPRSQGRRLKLERSKRHKIAFELRGASADIFHFAPGGETQQSIDLRVKDFEIFDHVPTSTWKKFVTYMHDAGPREEKKPMIHIEICNVRPVPDLTASELVLRVTILPLRLHIDQDALDFLTRFFEFSDQSSDQTKSSGPGEQPYLQRVEVRAVPVKLDYKPKKIDYGGLRSGRTTEFMNFFILDGADMVMRHTIVYGCSGFDKLHKALEDVWMPDIKKNQLPGVLSGLNGVRTLVNMGTGVRDLVVVPVREYRKDGRVVRSVSKGALAFARTTGSELTRFGAKLAVGAQTALQGAEDFFSRASAASPHTATSPSADWEAADLDAEERRAISHYADQPMGILQGLKGAARSLERDLLVTRDVIIAVSGEVRDSGSAEGVARAVARHAPTLVLRPMIGASKAVGQALMGATNTVDPGNRRRMEDKYKSY